VPLLSQKHTLKKIMMREVEVRVILFTEKMMQMGMRLSPLCLR